MKLQSGGAVQQETRRWDDIKVKSTVMRTKENAQDYRYFPDPDLLTVEIDDAWMEEIKSEIPELPIARYERYLKDYGMSEIDARQLSDSFEKGNLLDDKAIELHDTRLTADKLVDLICLIDSSAISGAAGKKVLIDLFEKDETAEQIVERLGLKQVSDETALLTIVQEVIAKNTKAVADFKAGKNVTGFLVGQCMKASKGQANPQILNKFIAQELAKL